MSTESPPPIRFRDGAAYERLMGAWSRAAGEVFLDWLALPPGLRWLDVGCGNGAFTEVIAQRCAPASIDGIDPSLGQLAFARTRPATADARYRQGDAMHLPYPDHAFDVAVMALVIFFVPDPASGVAQMVRTVRPGGTVAAYAWDMHGGGFPLEPLTGELRRAGHPVTPPPSVEASRLVTMRALGESAGLEDIETRQITVQRTFESFDDWWAAAGLSEVIAGVLSRLTPGEVAHLAQRVREQLVFDADGRVVHPARANAVKGRVPAR